MLRKNVDEFTKTTIFRKPARLQQETPSFTAVVVHVSD